jgi:hypothetical protein
LSQFHPTNVTLDPPPPQDQLATAVLQGLSRPLGAKLYWGVTRTLVLGAISFGVLPLLAWVRSFRKFAVAEQQQFLHLAQWIRNNSNHPLARRLEADAAELQPRPWLDLLSIGILITTAVLIGTQIADVRTPLNALLAGTFGFQQHRVFDITLHYFPRAEGVFTVWVWGLAAAYAAHWLQVQLHAQDVKRFVARFSEIAKAEGVNAVKADSLGIPVRPLWLVAGVILYNLQAPWGLLATLAGGAQKRYITWTSRNTRADVAHRLRAMLTRRYGAASIPVPVYLRVRCVEAKCRAEVPRGVNYCPRCGTRQKAEVNRVA